MLDEIEMFVLESDLSLLAIHKEIRYLRVEECFADYLLLYSLRPEILVRGMDESRCILVLNTSISATSNFKRRE